MKTLSADGSVGSPHVRVGHRQDLFMKGRTPKGCGLFYFRDLQLAFYSVSPYARQYGIRYVEPRIGVKGGGL